jgi:uncharacterized protein involved in response to NO
MPAHKLLYPAAAFYAAFMLPASVAAMFGWITGLPGLALPVGHAHEMIFGFGLAAVAGNQLGPVRRSTLAVLFALWLAARVSFVIAPGWIGTTAMNAAFAGLLAVQLLPRLVAPVRKLRNRALPLAVASLCVAAIAMQAALLAGSGRSQATVLVAAVLLLALLMLFMGGRIIAPAAAGQLYRQGGDLAARVQPRLEGTLIVLVFASIVALVMDSPRVASAGLAAASLVALTRLARWRLWALHGRPDILCLATGYAWLVAGLAAVAVSLFIGIRPVTALHVITIGAMGTLTINVMALTYARLARRDLSVEKLPIAATALVALAVAARVGADLATADPRAWLAAAAACWSAAYLLVMACFVRLNARSTQPGLPSTRGSNSNGA